MIVLFNDMRVLTTLESLRRQAKKPDSILIADGGSNEVFIKQICDFITENKLKNVELKILPGRCIDTRRQVIDYLIDKTDIIAFIDSDEEAYNIWWLIELLNPIIKGEADFVGGNIIPTTAKTDAERILNIIQYQSQEMYDKDISYIAMGNSAWKMDIFKKIGNFDASSISTKTDKDYTKGKIGGSYHVSDDYDINVRAVNAGFKGVFAKDAQVLHNQSQIDSTKKLIKYFYSQFVRTSMAYFKHGMSLNKFTKGTTKIAISHPFQFILILIRPIAMIRGWIEWKKCLNN